MVFVLILAMLLFAIVGIASSLKSTRSPPHPLPPYPDRSETTYYEPVARDRPSLSIYPSKLLEAKIREESKRTGKPISRIVCSILEKHYSSESESKIEKIPSSPLSNSDAHLIEGADSDHAKCSICGSAQRDNRNVCYHCSVDFVRKNQIHTIKRGGFGMSNPDWEAWRSCHDGPDQRNRIQKAKSKNMTPLSINTDAECSCVIAGSEGRRYNVRLSGCDCEDFAIRQGVAPCKHMYRLAMELSLLPNEGVESDLQSALLMLQQGELRSFIRSGPLLDSIELCRYAAMVYRSSKGVNLPLPSRMPHREDCYLFDYSTPRLVKRVNDKAKDIKTLQELLQNRLGKLCMNNLDNNSFIFQLAQLDPTASSAQKAEAISVEEFVERVSEG